MASSSKIPRNEDIDYSDIEAKYHIPQDDTFDNVVVLDNVPIVEQSKKDRLLNAIARKFASKGAPVTVDSFHLPWDDAAGKSKGFMFIEFKTAEEAENAIAVMNGVPFDAKHTFLLNHFTDIERFADLNDQYVEPEIPPYQAKEHLRWWLADGKDQFLTYQQDDVAIHWHAKTTSEVHTHRKNWTDLFAAWSPLGTYLTSIHRPGVRVWGGESWAGIGRFAHPFVKLLDFSPCENYLVTWSQEAIVRGGDFGEEDEGNHIAVWDIKTGGLLRTFPMIQEQPQATQDGEGAAPKKMQWPALKWSPDDKYVARITPGQQISVYELPSMGLLDKKSVKIEGVVDFDWCPNIDDEEVAQSSKGKKAAAKKEKENFLAYWTPELANQPARISLMAFPSRAVLKTKNLFNVADAKLHWQQGGTYLCVKVDHFTKTKKSTYCNLEIFRVREKEYPVEVVEIKDTVTDFAWDPKSDRFAIVTSSDPNLGNIGPGITIKTEVLFYQLDQGVAVPKFKLLKKLETKANTSPRTSNTLRWSPKGRHIVLATVGSSSKFDLEFWDVDFLADAPQAGEWGAGVQLLGSGEHYGVTDIDWDPSGRFIATSASAWRHSLENGYTIWDFKGQELQKHVLDRFKQFLWRPRPKTLLSKEQQKAIIKKLKDFGRIFDEEDAAEESSASKELVAHRKRLVDEWNAWRAKVRADQHADRRKDAREKEEATEVIEEWIEEVLSETVEVLE